MILRTRDYDRMFARALPHVFEKQKWKSAEVVAMQMADDDRVERVGLDTMALHLGDHAGARFEQDSLPAGFQKISRLRPATTSEGVTGS